MVPNPFTDKDYAAMRYEIHYRIYRTSLAPGLPPISEDVVAEKSADGMVLGWIEQAPTERDAWAHALPFVSHVVFGHPEVQGWKSVSIRSVNATLTEL